MGLILSQAAGHRLDHCISLLLWSWKLQKLAFINHLKNEKKGRKSPCWAPLFFFKGSDKRLFGMVDCRALNQIPKRNNALVSRGRLFDRLGAAKVFPKLSSKSGFHRFHVKLEDTEKRLATPNVTGLGDW